MTDNQKPTWLRDAERYVRTAQKLGDYKDGELQRLTANIAHMTQENLDLTARANENARDAAKWRKATHPRGLPTNNARIDEAEAKALQENAELETKECRELLNEGTTDAQVHVMVHEWTKEKKALEEERASRKQSVGA